jgi:Arc/MetJ-type ribon-helix-helix transcriptional regulator
VTKAISVRLDEDVQRALATLEAAGTSRSDAIRKAILDAAAAAKRHAALREEVAALERDEADREEMRSVAALMEALRAAG